MAQREHARRVKREVVHHDGDAAVLAQPPQRRGEIRVAREQHECRSRADGQHLQLAVEARDDLAVCVLALLT